MLSSYVPFNTNFGCFTLEIFASYTLDDEQMQPYIRFVYNLSINYNISFLFAPAYFDNYISKMIR